jgi:hypothetical protein
LLLGALWLAIALPINFVGFVVIHTPPSMSAHDFYLGQFPWIYLVYAAAFLGPACAAAPQAARAEASWRGRGRRVNGGREKPRRQRI